MSQFNGKVALVTGAAGGIGRASALEFAARGAAVVVTDRAEDVEETAQAITEAGGTACAEVTDVADPDAVRVLIERTMQRFGRLDFAHNNAGVSGTGLVAELEPEEFERIIRVNLMGVFACLRYELPPMLRAGAGAIVNTASIWAFTGSRGKSAYTASKHAVVGLTRAAALDHGGGGVRINAVAPGPIETAMTAAVPAERMRDIVARTAEGRMGQPHEVARAVAWLCSDEASYVNGAVLPVDGGWLAA
jgi:NAD(P)-dependent dehydrogenase (short-subunit alcohol dehydrogenase family)